jgi:4-aminobutyrate--pyruvate transaminase
VALENVRLIEERGLVEHAAKMGDRLLSGLSRHADDPLVGEIRGIGFIAAVELVAEKSTKARFDPPGHVGAYFNSRCQAHGMIVRNIAIVLPSALRFLQRRAMSTSSSITLAKR